MEFNGLSHYDPNLVETVYDENQSLYEEHDGGYQLGDHFGDGEYRETQTILADGGERFGVSSVAFDHQEELLWMGNQGGHVTSYYSPAFEKYTSFQVHSTEEVRDIHTFEEGILALTPSSFRCQMRRGIPIYTYTSRNLIEMQCFTQITPTNVLMGGHQPHLVNFDFNTSQETQLIQTGENGCAILRLQNRFICAGDPVGNIKLLDPVTLQIEHNLETHSGSLSDFDIHGNLLVTCGFSQRQGTLTTDRFLMVYDFRMMRAVSPIPVVVDPLLMKFLPSFSSRVAVVSTLGQMQLVDTVALSESELCLYQINTASSPLTLDVSPSCQYLCIGDSGGQIHLFGSSAPNASFNGFSRDTEFADPSESLPMIPFDDFETPLSSIPMLLESPETKLVSDWPDRFLKVIYRPDPSVDPEILKSMKIQGTIGYAPNPATTRRNQVPYNNDNKRGNGRNKNANNGDVSSRGGSLDAVAAIPKRYRKTELKHSNKDDFDFEPYNKTRFCGLEANLPNNYCNVMLQMLYFLEPVRSMALAHLCSKEFCLCCELSFLFTMLESSQKTPCQASNFLRAFRTVPEASALGLILSDQNPESKKKTNLIRLIQSWNRFILHQLHFETYETRKRKSSETDRKRNASSSPRGKGNYQQSKTGDTGGVDHANDDRHRHPRGKSQTVASDHDDVLEGSEDRVDDETETSRLFGMKQLQINRCLKCATDVNKESTLLLCNLIYPARDAATEAHSFCQVLSKSMCPEQTTPAWCDKCNKFTPTLQLKRLEALPHILALNCGMDNQNDKDFWQVQMDRMIENVTKQPENNGGPAAPAGKENKSNGNQVSKPCRYGEHCTRANCRFRHPGQEPDKSNNTNLNQLYYTHPWLPTHIRIDLNDSGSVEITKLTDGDLEKPDEPRNCKQSVRYDLVGVVCHITESEDKKNLVAFVNVGPKYHERAGESLDSQWYLFNNFCVTNVPEQEVTWFNLEWKVPCVFYWVNRDLPSHFCPANIPNPITVDVFGEDKSIARDRGRKRITFMPLGVDEMPKKGELVAMDAEFVTLNQEEAELRSDGKLSTVKPSHMSVARITCIRGQGILEGTPFIDDYISTQEQVYDYLTKFSGIQPGDLDANFSSKHLTTLKSTYLKLRFLVDIGVKFVGHGLRNDFRVINIYVPPEQVIDTVFLFHLPRQRMVSLRFLAWHFLGIKIQSVTHDSIEDARAALQLYFHYLKLAERGIVQEELEKLYETGKSLQWTVPDGEDPPLGWQVSDEEL